MDEQGAPPPDTGVLSRTTPRRKRRLAPVLAIVGLVLLGLVIWRVLSPGASTERGRGQSTQAQPVGAAKVTTGNIRVILAGLGTVTPLATVTVQTQINGQLMSVGFREGQIVHKGDFLAQIDPRPYQAALDTAQGALAHDTGLLQQAQSDLKRYQTLGRQDSIALQQVADQEFLVKQDQGTVIEDQGTIETDKLNLVYCHIVAPVTGRVGLRLVDPGNYVQTTSTTGLVVLTQLQPISVVFVLPESQIPEVAQELDAQDGSPAGSPPPGELSVAAYDSSNTNEIASGQLTSVDNEVDTTTGTVKLRATFPNGDFKLFPNQFVNARLLLRTLDNVTVAPVAAIQHGGAGSFVYLIKPDSTVSVQNVKVGETDGDNVQILSGLKAGDEVVVDGADQLRAGSKVKISADQGNPEATVNNGPGAPPGQQPDNAVPVPAPSKTPPAKQ